jgi:DNA-binding response OmpR family regulator
MSIYINCSNYTSDKMLVSDISKQANESFINNQEYYSKTQTLVGHNPIRKVTPIEAALLNKLLEHRGQVLTMKLLEEMVYGSQGYKIKSNALTVHMHNLRRKFPELKIKTIRGVGYVLKNSQNDEQTTQLLYEHMDTA